MRLLSSSLFLMALLGGGRLAFAADVGGEAQLIDSINAYRSEVQRCGNRASEELTPLQSDSRLVLPATGAGDLQGALARAGYPMVNVQAISLSGPRSAAHCWKSGSRRPAGRASLAMKEAAATIEGSSTTSGIRTSRPLIWKLLAIA